VFGERFGGRTLSFAVHKCLNLKISRLEAQIKRGHPKKAIKNDHILFIPHKTRSNQQQYPL
jgi:hypothetical protein